MSDSIELLAELREERAQLIAASKVIEKEMADASDKLGTLEEKLETCEKEILKILRGFITEIAEDVEFSQDGHAVAADSAVDGSAIVMEGGE